jgi:hypothetical protein
MSEKMCAVNMLVQEAVRKKFLPFVISLCMSMEIITTRLKSLNIVENFLAVASVTLGRWQYHS